MPAITLGNCLDQLQLAVVIAVVSVRMVQVAVDEIVDVVPMWYGWVATIRPMHVSGFMPFAAMIRSAFRRIGGAYLDLALVDMVLVRVVQVAVVKVVNMVPVPDCNVAAIRPVHVGMVVVDVMLVHGGYLLLEVFMRDVSRVRDSLGSLSTPSMPANGCAGPSVACAIALNNSATTCWSANRY